MQQKPDNLRWPKGVTLLEMVVAMSVMAIVLAAVLPLFAGIRNSWDTKQANTEIIQNARVLADHLHRNLATAARITDVSSSEDNGFIEFTANDGNAYRYAVGEDNYVQFGPSGEVGDLAGPVSQFKLTCYNDNDFVTPITDPALIRLVTIEFTFPNPAPLGREKTFTTCTYVRSSGGGFEPGVAVADLIAWGGRDTVIDSYRSTAGAYNPAKPGAEAVVSANATGFGTITLVSRTAIRGDAYIGPGGNPNFAIITWGGAEITGKRSALTKAVNLPVPSAPQGSVFDGSHEGDLLLWGDGSKTIRRDHYFNKVELWGNSKLVISGQITLLVNDTFNIGDRAEIRILRNSSLTLYAKNGIGIWGSARLNDSTGDPSKLRVFIIGRDKALDMANDAVIHAVVENPTGRVSLWNGAQLFGKVRAGHLLGGGQIHVDLDCSFSLGNN